MKLVEKNPVEMLLERAERHPDKVYLRQPYKGHWIEYTWAQVADQVQRMASALKSMGIQQGDKVAIAGSNTAHWIMADLASTMAGAAAVGLYPKMSGEHINYILEHSEAKLIFLGPMIDAETVDKSIPEGMPRIRLPYKSVTIHADHEWDDLVAANEPIADYKAPSDDEIWAMIYTSGTTGAPKGVMISGKNVRTSVSGLLEVLGEAEDERWFSYLPLAHIFERGIVELASLYQGAQVNFLESQEKFAEQLKEVAPTRFIGVPLIWSRIQSKVMEQMPKEKMDRLLRIPIVRGLVKKKLLEALGMQNVRIAFSGAAPLAPSVMEWWSRFGIDVCQGYGMSENAAYCTANLPNANRPGSVGRAMPGVEIKISESGEILCKSGAVFPGYYKQPDKTAETFTKDGWLRTGDRGRFDDDGYLYITGRVKDIFKTDKGKYVAPAPIEGQFEKNQYVDSLCLIGSGQKQPVMIVTLSEAAQGVSEDEITDSLQADLNSLNKELEPHERIAKLVVSREPWSIDAGHMTPTMKVRRHFIEEQYGQRVSGWYAKSEDVVWI